MFSHHRRSQVAVILTALVATTVFASHEAYGQVKPFKIRGKGLILDPIPLGPGTARHVIRGNATHLGRHSGAGVAKILTVNLETGMGTFMSDRPFVFVAANGDKLAFHYGNPEYAAKVGVVQIVPVGDKFKTVWTAEFNPAPEESTGRFRKVTRGRFIMIAETASFTPGDSNVPYEWSGQGWIYFAKGYK